MRKRKGENDKMAKYITKPIEVEAFQYDGDLKGANGEYYVPQWAVKAFQEGMMHYDSLVPEEPPCDLFINTPEGVCHVVIGDYIIKGAKGELYSCKPGIFKETYKEVLSTKELVQGVMNNQ